MAMHPRILLQVTMPALAISALLVGTCAIGVWSLNRLQANRVQIVSKCVESLEAAQELELNLRQLRFHSLLYMMDATPNRQRPIEEDQQEFEIALARARRSADLPQERSLIEQMDAGYRRYRSELDRAQPFLPEASLADVLRWADAHPVQPLIGPSHDLLRINREAMEASARDSEAVSQQVRTTLLLLAVLAPVGGLVGGFGVAWGLSRSITRLSVRLHDVHTHLDRDLGSVRLKVESDLGHLDQQMEHVVSRVRDVVDQLHRQQQDMLRAEQLAAVGRLAAGVAHEVRNPLASIKLLVGAALHSQPPRHLTPEDLRVIHKEVGRLERKVQDLLDYARPQAIVRRPCDLREVVKGAVELVMTRAQQQAVRTCLTLPDGPVRIAVDADQLTGVFVNLLLNALDAMPRGGELSVTLETGPDDQVRVEVTDTGNGIDPAVASRLFTPFTSTKPTGTGLGLSTCRRVVEQHGGLLKGENRPEGGACFTMTLHTTVPEVTHANGPARR